MSFGRETARTSLSSHKMTEVPGNSEQKCKTVASCRPYGYRHWQGMASTCTAPKEKAKETVIPVPRNTSPECDNVTMVSGILQKVVPLEHSELGGPLKRPFFRLSLARTLNVIWPWLRKKTSSRFGFADVGDSPRPTFHNRIGSTRRSNDGIRILAYKKATVVSLLSRNDKNRTKRLSRHRKRNRESKPRHIVAGRRDCCF